jgi:adenine deaminase
MLGECLENLSSPIMHLTEVCSPEIVIINGKIVAQNNQAEFENTDPVPEFTLNTIHLDPYFFSPEAYHIFPRSADQKSAWIQGMEMFDGYFKRAFHAKLPASSDSPHHLLCDPTRDILKVVVIDRHHSTKSHGISYVRGFGLEKGAIGCTTNCENQNLVIVGTSDEEIAHVAKAIDELGGGMIAVCEAAVLCAVRLDVAGCMSSAPWEEVRDDSIALDKKVKEVLGGVLEHPFLIASFVGLVAVPDLGLTEKGLVYGGGEGLMDPVLEAEEDGIVSVVGAQDLKVGARICCRCPSHAHDVHRFMDAGTAVDALSR